MSSIYWNHRVLRKSPDDRRPDYHEFFISEVYFNSDDGRIIGWTEQEIVWGESVEEIRQSLEWMLEALDKPVVVVEELEAAFEKLREDGVDGHDQGVEVDGR